MTYLILASRHVTFVEAKRKLKLDHYADARWIAGTQSSLGEGGRHLKPPVTLVYARDHKDIPFHLTIIRELKAAVCGGQVEEIHL